MDTKWNQTEEGLLFRCPMINHMSGDKPVVNKALYVLKMIKNQLSRSILGSLGKASKENLIISLELDSYC